MTLDHIPRELSPNGSLDSAPKDFTVYVSLLSISVPFERVLYTHLTGYLSHYYYTCSQGLNSVRGEHTPLGTFTYNIDSTMSAIQQFSVKVSILHIALH